MTRLKSIWRWLTTPMPIPEGEPLLCVGTHFPFIVYIKTAEPLKHDPL